MKRYMSFVLPFLLALACVVLTMPCLVSCKRDKVIPRKEMAEIYAEMFKLDATIVKQRNLQRAADTSRVYAAILEKYGYTEADFLKSQEKYLLDANRYARILKRSQRQLEAELKDLKKERDNRNLKLKLESNRKEFIAGFRPDTLILFDTASIAFCLSFDSLAAFDRYPYADTVFAGPKIVVRSQDCPDSLDSVKTYSLTFAKKTDIHVKF